MTIYQLNKFVTCILMYKHNRGILSNIFNDMFMMHTPSHNYNMRQHIAYKIPHCKTNIKQNTLTYVGPKLWNTVIMKNHIDNCTSISIFKKAMKQGGIHVLLLLEKRNYKQFASFLLIVDCLS